MNPEFDRELCEKFPLLYSNRHSDPKTTILAWGFDIDDGWVPLIRDLSEKLERLIMALPEEERAEYRAEQVKEKFGGLRFYMSKLTVEMQAAIREAEALSTSVCEVCSAPGETCGGGWIKTLCAVHEEERRRSR